jgi:hypothetical protein
MVISAYQINNVLRVYGDQLRQSRMSARPKSIDQRSPDTISISATAKRKSIIDKIADNIVERISRFGPNDDIEKEVFQKLEDELGSQLTVTPENTPELIFKEIDDSGETIRSFSIDDSNLLSHKLKEITKETLDKNMM